MDEQDFTFRAEIAVDDRNAITTLILEGVEGLDREEVSAVIEHLKNVTEAKFGLVWDLDQGKLTGDVTLKVPCDYDLDDPLTEESLMVNYQDEVSYTFDIAISQQIEEIRESQI